MYDASIKMAFKLFNEKKNTHKIEKILKTSLSSIDDAIVITDSSGNIIELNMAFAKIQGFSGKDECIKNINDYPGCFEVYISNGAIVVIRKVTDQYKDDIVLFNIRKGERT